MRDRNTVHRITFAASRVAALVFGIGLVLPAAALQSALSWVSPLNSADIKIGRQQAGTQGGPERVDGGAVTKFCAGTIPMPDGDHLSCKLTGADPGYQYFVCARDASGEDLGGFQCGFYGNGGGWECTPTDLAASWCD